MNMVFRQKFIIADAKVVTFMRQFKREMSQEKAENWTWDMVLLGTAKKAYPKQFALAKKKIKEREKQTPAPEEDPLEDVL